MREVNGGRTCTKEASRSARFQEAEVSLLQLSLFADSAKDQFLQAKSEGVERKANGRKKDADNAAGMSHLLSGIAV